MRAGRQMPLKEEACRTVENRAERVFDKPRLAPVIWLLKVTGQERKRENHMLIQLRHDTDEAPRSPQPLRKVDPSSDPRARAAHCPPGRGTLAPCHVPHKDREHGARGGAACVREAAPDL